MSVQDCSEELSLHLEDGEFLEECREANGSVKVSPLSKQKRLREPEDQGENKKFKVSICCKVK